MALFCSLPDVNNVGHLSVVLLAALIVSRTLVLLVALMRPLMPQTIFMTFHRLSHSLADPFPQKAQTLHENSSAARKGYWRHTT